MRVTVSAGFLAIMLISACGETSDRQPFYPGSDGTWSWNGSTWTELSTENAGLNLVYWKDLGGLIGWSYSLSSTSVRSNWKAKRWNGLHWVPDEALPSPPPYGSESLQISCLVLDEASNQLLCIDNDATTIWAWSNGIWATAVSPAQWPKGSKITRFAYDPYRRTVLIFAWKEPQPGHAETWEWDGRALKHLTTFNLAFGASETFWVVPDGAGHMLALGYETGFSWDSTRWSPTGSGCPSSTSSDALRQWQMAYDVAHQELIAIGSREDGSAGTWQWIKESWKPLASASAPSGGHSSLTYDPELPGLVLTTFPIGGCCFDKGCGPPMKF